MKDNYSAEAIGIITRIQADIPTRALRDMAPVFPDWLATMVQALQAVEAAGYSRGLEDAEKACRKPWAMYDYANTHTVELCEAAIRELKGKP